MDIKRIRLVAPPTPACFADRLSWAEYLASAMEAKVKSACTRPFINGRFNASFSHCVDCTAAHRRAMCAEKRCHPPKVAPPEQAQPCHQTEPA